MKRQYITPSVFCVKLDPKRTFLVASPLELSEEKTEEGGWAREDNNNTDENNNRNSVWDNAW